MFVTELGIMTVTIFGQFSKQAVDKDCTEDEITKLVAFTQFLKQVFPRLITEFGSVIFCKLLQFWNELVPKVINEVEVESMVKLVKAEQLSKQFGFIDVTELGITILLRVDTP
jgi:hypothetical protein